ncbi:MAG: fused MFS/spermidine synthase [Melioribacteraceae bacterium]
MSIGKQHLKTIVYLLFVVSGITGLIYQIVWFKFISLFLGNTTYAQMTVLATFLGGLAIGNHLFGKKSDSLKNPVKIYSLLELFIGTYCLFYPLLSGLLGNLFLSTAPELNTSSQNILFNGLRFLTAALLLFAPTAAMGGTLPILSRFFVDNLQNTRKEIAVLYFLNSFGAVVGVVFAGFVLIKEFGLNVTIYAAAVLNIIAGMIGLLVSSSSKIIRQDEPTSSAEDKEEIILPGADKKTVRAAITVAGLSGMAALIYEMVWVRLLVHFFGSSTYAFSIMLMAFIGGIALGSLLISKNFFKKFNYVKLLVSAQGIIAFSTMIILLLYERLPYFFWRASTLLSRSAESFGIFLGLEFITAFSILIIPTLFMGMALPVAAEIVSSSNKKVGLSVGRVFSVNTFGAVAGVILSGLLFIPLFGIKGSFEIGILLNIVAAAILVWSYDLYSSRTRIFLTGIFTLSFLIYLILFPSWNRSVMIKGIFRSLGSAPPESFAEFSKDPGIERIVFYEEGINATVAVTQSIANPGRKRLIINGKPDASSYFDMPTQVLLAQIPMMIHPDPKNIFVVGFGSGTTIGSILTQPAEKVTCAEISREVINAAGFFKIENRNCVSDPRLRIINEDAVTLLKLSKEKYDVIISEPSNPWIAGIGNLFSKEYFEKCSAALNKGGLMVQWFHLYEADDDVVKLVLNTFASVFPYAQMWNSIANDIILVGSKTDFNSNLPLLQKKFSTPAVNMDFERIGIRNLFTFLSCQSVSPRGFFKMTSDLPVNSEIHPRLEFMAPKAFYIGRPSGYVYGFDEKFDTLSGGLFAKEFVKSFPPDKNTIASAIQYFLETKVNNRFAYGLSKYLQELYPADYSANTLLYRSIEGLPLLNRGSVLLKSLIDRFPDSTRIIKDFNNVLISEKTNASTYLKIYSIKEEAAAFIKTTKPDSVSKINVYLQLANGFLLNGEYREAAGMVFLVEKILRANPELIKSIDAENYYYLGAVSSLFENDYEKVIGYYVALVNLNRDYKDRFSLRRSMSWHTRQLKLK